METMATLSDDPVVGLPAGHPTHLAPPGNAESRAGYTSRRATNFGKLKRQISFKQNSKLSPSTAP